MIRISGMTGSLFVPSAITANLITSSDVLFKFVDLRLCRGGKCDRICQICYSQEQQSKRQNCPERLHPKAHHFGEEGHRPLHPPIPHLPPDSTVLHITQLQPQTPIATHHGLAHVASVIQP
jgi:hypothetical protein